MGIPIIDTDKCDACETCVDECPEGALEIIDGVAVSSAVDCTGCGECEDVCPADAIKAS